MTPFVVYDHGPDSKRVMVTPDPVQDAIVDAEGVCLRLTFVALEHHVDAVAGIVSDTGQTSLLRP